MSSTRRSDPLDRLIRAMDVALDREGPGTDAEVLERHPEIRDLLEGMLEASAPATESPAMPMGEPAEDLPVVGRSFGRYRIESELGRGGQSEVYLAMDTSLSRRVALKLLRAPWFVEGDRRERFRREALLASRLDHPGICPVHDAGVECGIPYIAMRHIDGRPLSSLLAEDRERGRPPPAETVLERARLLEEVALAVHAAHEASILHRDLKPANIMVARDGRPIVLDFGLAREEEHGGTVTQSGAIFGTPAYMAPEQVTGGAAGADRRTDVYALGVTLYEAATGRRPFDAATTIGLYRAIREDEPRDPRALNPAVPRDLAAVILTAMDKEPSRRYLSAGALALDLARVRERRPVLARRSGPMLRLGRWVQRRPALAAALAALVLALTSGLAVALLLLWEKDRALDTARRESVRAEENLESAFDTVDRMLLGVAENQIARNPAQHALRKTILAEAVGLYEKLIRQREGDPGARHDVARAHGRLAEALRIEGDLAGAETHFRLSLRLLDDLIAEGGRPLLQLLDDRSRGASTLALTLRWRARYEEAEGILREMIRTARSCRPRLESQSMIDYLVATTAVILGGVLQVRGRYREAIEEIRGAIGVLEKEPRAAPEDRIAAWYGLGGVLENIGDHAAAEGAFRTSFGILRPDASAPLPASARDRSQAVELLGNLGSAQRRRGRPDEAEAALKEAVAIAGTILKDGAETPADLLVLAMVRCDLGLILLDRRHAAGAVAEASAALDLCRRAAELAPESEAMQAADATALAVRGIARLESGEVEAAEADCREALASLDRTPGTADGRWAAPFDRCLRLAHNLACHFRKGNLDLAKASALAGEGLRRAEVLLERSGENAVTLSRTAQLLQVAGRIEDSRGRPEDARRLLERAMTLGERMLGHNPDWAEAHLLLATLWGDLAIVSSHLDPPAELDRCRDEVLARTARAEALLPPLPALPGEHRLLAVACYCLAEALLASGDHQAAAAALDRIPALAAGDAGILRNTARLWADGLVALHRNRDDMDRAAFDAARHDATSRAIGCLSALVAAAGIPGADLAADRHLAPITRSPEFKAWLESSGPLPVGAAAGTGAGGPDR